MKKQSEVLFSHLVSGFHPAASLCFGLTANQRLKLLSTGVGRIF